MEMVQSMDCVLSKFLLFRRLAVAMDPSAQTVSERVSSVETAISA